MSTNSNMFNHSDCTILLLPFLEWRNDCNDHISRVFVITVKNSAALFSVLRTTFLWPKDYFKQFMAEDEPKATSEAAQPKILASL